MLYVKWTMGFSPVADNDRVDVLFADGYECCDLPAKAFNWDKVVAYRKKAY